MLLEFLRSFQNIKPLINLIYINPNSFALPFKTSVLHAKYILLAIYHYLYSINNNKKYALISQLNLFIFDKIHM